MSGCLVIGKAASAVEYLGCNEALAAVAVGVGVIARAGRGYEPVAARGGRLAVAA